LNGGEREKGAILPANLYFLYFAGGRKKPEEHAHEKSRPVKSRARKPPKRKKEKKKDWFRNSGPWGQGSARGSGRKKSNGRAPLEAGKKGKKKPRWLLLARRKTKGGGGYGGNEHTNNKKNTRPFRREKMRRSDGERPNSTNMVIQGPTKAREKKKKKKGTKVAPQLLA